MTPKEVLRSFGQYVKESPEDEQKTISVGKHKKVIRNLINHLENSLANAQYQLKIFDNKKGIEISGEIYEATQINKDLIIVSYDSNVVGPDELDDIYKAITTLVNSKIIGENVLFVPENFNVLGYRLLFNEEEETEEEIDTNIYSKIILDSEKFKLEKEQ